MAQLEMVTLKKGKIWKNEQTSTEIWHLNNHV